MGLRDRARVRSEARLDAALIERYATKSGRDTSALGWHDVFARWKLAVVLEGSYAKFRRGQSDKPIHEFNGRQVDVLVDTAAAAIDGEDT